MSDTMDTTGTGSEPPQNEAPEIATPRGYRERDDFVPDPAAQTATFDTSGVGGGLAGKIEETSPIFEVAKAQDLDVARRALDPSDTTVHESLVVLPPVLGDGATDLAKERVLQAASAQPDSIDVSSSRITPAQEAAAETTAVEEPDPENPDGDVVDAGASQQDDSYSGSTIAGSDAGSGGSDDPTFTE